MEEYVVKLKEENNVFVLNVSVVVFVKLKWMDVKIHVKMVELILVIFVNVLLDLLVPLVLQVSFSFFLSFFFSFFFSFFIFHFFFFQKQIETKKNKNKSDEMSRDQ